MLTPPDSDGTLVAECARVLKENWRTGLRDGRAYAYTAPSLKRYPWQWYWDSCLIAICWRRIDPVRARRELESLLSVARDDGFIGHTIFWGEPVRGGRRLFYNIHAPTDLTTISIQPPVLAWAWHIAVGDPTLEPRIVRHHEWLAANRAIDGDDLLWIVQPDESGLDASPKFDAIWGWRSHSRPGFPVLVRRNVARNFDARRIAADGGPVVCEVLTNVLYGLSRLALGQASITPRIVERLYDERRGLFIDEPRPGPRSTILTWSALVPLALPDLPEAIGRRLVEEHLLRHGELWAPVPPPSVALNEPSFTVRDVRLGLRRYWRGPTWVNAAWLLWLGLVRLGYREQARELTRRLAGAIRVAGLREYYDPLTGAGLGADDFAWSALIMEMLEPDPAAGRSHLETVRTGRAVG